MDDLVEFSRKLHQAIRDRNGCGDLTCALVERPSACNCWKEWNDLDQRIKRLACAQEKHD